MASQWSSRDATTVCALLTCFNRRAQTLVCLEALERSATEAGIVISAVLVDDGSSDGTAEAVRARFPWVQVTRAAGDLYWCRGMHRAHELAARADPDHYLWLNDDTVVKPAAIKQLLACLSLEPVKSQSSAIVIGNCHATAEIKRTYGGVRLRSNWLRTRFSAVEPSDVPQQVDTFDGNLVLVSRSAAAVVGNLDPAYEHAMGDYDYGLRAKGLGVPCFIAPGYQASCDHNAVAGTFMDSSLSLTKRCALIFSRKGLPPSSWWRFNRLHGGIFGPATFAWPYLRVVVQSLLAAAIAGKR